jgi:hypothetical protein
VVKGVFAQLEEGGAWAQVGGPKFWAPPPKGAPDAILDRWPATRTRTRR